MGIRIGQKIDLISESEFRKTDYEVTGLAYQVHRDLGRFCIEKIYQTSFANLCGENGIKVDVEVPIIVNLDDFIKRYYIDILINNSIIYEFKSLSFLLNEHKTQVLNYLLLSGINHGKVINFGTNSVDYKFVSTTLNTVDRYKLTIDSRHWENTDEDSKWLKELILKMLNEWGGFLDIQLYYDGIYWFRGGKENIVNSINIYQGEKIIGKQNFCLLNSQTAFRLSGITKEKKYYRNHLKQLLSHSSLKILQWINFNHHNIEFETIKKDNK